MLMEHKFLEPYFINNRTKIQFKNSKKASNKQSLADIFRLHCQQNLGDLTLYFKSYAFNRGNTKLGRNHSCEFQANQIKKNKNLMKACSVEMNKLNLASHNEDFEFNNCADIEYFEIQIRKVAIPGLQQPIHCMQFAINNITTLIKNQQKLSDDIYQDAIEANFSHEQMNPLNNIIQNASTVHSTVTDLFGYDSNNDRLNNVLKLVKAINDSSTVMLLFSKNQIQRMKAKQGKYQSMPFSISDLQKKIQKVLNPFEMQVVKQQAKVLFANLIETEYELTADWEAFKLILFNFLQNAVKYNSKKGVVMLIARLDQQPENQAKSKAANLCIQIVDTGEGIDKSRQNLLFKPFKELQKK